MVVGRVRKIIQMAFAFGVVFPFVCLYFAAEYQYFGSAKANKCHYFPCEWAEKISPKNLVTFRSAEEALDTNMCLAKSVNR